MHKELSTWPKYEQALKVGFGSVYWMEGVVTRAVDKRGGNGKLLNILRVNNDVFCNLAALIQVDDSDEKNITAEFLRFASIPGLSVSHPAITYDFVTDLYWMVSNTNRDSLRRWDMYARRKSHLHITRLSHCEVDRSALFLHYSTNLIDWVSAGPAVVHQHYTRHSTYPHVLIDGADLLLVSRSTLDYNTSLEESRSSITITTQIASSLRVFKTSEREPNYAGRYLLMSTPIFNGISSTNKIKRY